MMAGIRNNFKNIKFIIVSAIFLTLLCASAYTILIKKNEGKEQYVYIEEEVRKGDLILGIMESGSISLEVETLDYDLQINTSEEDEEDEDEEDEEDEDEEETIKYLAVEDVYVVSGERITEGEKLFKLTKDSMTAVGKKLNTLSTEAQIAFNEAETEYKIELLQAKSTFDTSMLEADRAETSYQASAARTQENINSLTAENKVLQAEITYNEEQLAEETLWDSFEEAQTAYTSAKNIYEDTDVHNATAYAGNYADYKSAKEQLDMIQEEIENLEETITENEKTINKNNENITRYQSSLEVEGLTNKSVYDSAVLGGAVAEDIYHYTVSSLEEAVTSAKSDMEEADSNLEAFHAFVGNDGIVYADGTGLVTEVSYQSGDKLIDIGAMISYVEEDSYLVTIDVSEEDISAIKVGDKVDIIMKAYPDADYEGTVVSITTTAASDYAATVSYPVMIKIEGDTSLLYGGMTAEVTFVTDSVTDVLYISRKAVQEIEGKSYVYIKDTADNRKLLQVETGFTDGTHVEIKDGLSEGDMVYIESKISGNKEQLMESDTKKQP